MIWSTPLISACSLTANKSHLAVTAEKLVPNYDSPTKQNNPILIGTRNSKLACLQTELVTRALRKHYPELQTEAVFITSSGDKDRSRPIVDLNIRAAFVKELEDALLDSRIDLAAHSLKDLPADLPPGLCLAAVLDRLDPRDVLVSKNQIRFLDLPPGSKIATSSRRRTAQLRNLRPDLDFIDIRGNVTTRLRKHEEGACQAIILAAAGLIRLNMQDRITEHFPLDMITPAAGQGTLAVECRQDNQRALQLAQAIDSTSIRPAIISERAFLKRLAGGCSTPIGAMAEILAGQKLKLYGCVASLDGKQLIRTAIEGSAQEAEQLGISLAETMIKLGAEKILNELRQTPACISPP